MCIITYLKWNPLRKDHQFNLELLYNLIRHAPSSPSSSSISKRLSGLRIGRLCVSISFHFKQASYSNEQMWNESLKIKDWAVRDQAEGRKIPPASAGGNENIRRQTGYYHISRQCLHSNSCDSLLRAGHFRMLALICLMTGWLCLMLHQENDHVLQNKTSRNLTLLFIAYTYSQPQKATVFLPHQLQLGAHLKVSQLFQTNMIHWTSLVYSVQVILKI